MDRNGQEDKPVYATASSPASTPPDSPVDLDLVFTEHHQRVFAAAYRITGNPMDAEDVLQTVFMRLLRREDGPDLSGNPAAYLHRAAVNAALDVVRSRKPSRAAGVDDLAAIPTEDPEASPEQRRRDGEIRYQVRRALGKLNPRTAEIFALRYFEGYGNHEIAELLGTSRSTVNVILHRARKRIQKEIRELAGDLS